MGADRRHSRLRRRTAVRNRAGPDVALGRTLPASNDVVFTEPLNSPMVRPELIPTFVFGGSQSQRVLNLDWREPRLRHRNQIAAD